MNAIDGYIDQFTGDKRKKLEEIRALIRENAPEASEKISWNMPTFFLNGNLVHFAMNKAHLGFYPTPSGIEHFEKELKDYRHSKGAIQFPLDKPLPKDLIAAIVQFRVAENTKKKYDKKRPLL